MLPLEIKKIMERFDQEGQEVYLVGGCVRDHLLGTQPQDYDMTTPLKPDQILALFPDYTCYTVGKKFGTIGILTDQGLVEVTTYRVDGAYSNGRKPDQVTFSLDLEEDLARRDFTINSMAYHPDKGLVDPFGGQADLEAGRIATVGNPRDRFQEDGLRILRAVRFMGQLNFRLDRQVEEAIRDQAHLIQALSPERIRDEMEKILLQDRPSACLYKLLDLGLLAYIFPDLMETVGFDQRSPYHDRTLFDHIACVVDHSPKKLALRWAALFHDIAKPQTMTFDEEAGKAHFFGHDTQGAQRAMEILRAYHQPKSLVHQVSTLIREHMKFHDQISDKALRRQIKRVGPDLILDLYDLMGADMACTYTGRSMDWLQERKDRIGRLMAQGGIEKNSLAIRGQDVIKLGIGEGPLVGHYLKMAQDLVLDDPSKNKKEILENYIIERMKEDGVKDPS